MFYKKKKCREGKKEKKPLVEGIDADAMSTSYDKWDKLHFEDAGVDESEEDRISKLKTTADGIFALDTPTAYRHALDLYLQIADICARSIPTHMIAYSHALLGVIACNVQLHQFSEALQQCESCNSLSFTLPMKQRLLYFRSVCRYKLKLDLDDAKSDMECLLSQCDHVDRNTLQEYKNLYNSICQPSHGSINIKEGWKLLESRQYSAASVWFLEALQSNALETSVRNLLLIGAGKSLICTHKLLEAGNMFEKAASDAAPTLRLRLLILSMHCKLAQRESGRDAEDVNAVLSNIARAISEAHANINNNSSTEQTIQTLHQTTALLLCEVRVSMLRNDNILLAAGKCQQAIEALRMHHHLYCDCSHGCSHDKYTTIFDSITSDAELPLLLHSAILFAYKAVMQIYALLDKYDEYIVAVDDALANTYVCYQPTAGTATSSQYQNRIYFLCHKIGFILNHDPDVSSKLSDVDGMWGLILLTVSNMVEVYPELLSTGVYQMVQCGSYYMSRAGLAPYAIDDIRFPGGKNGSPERELAEKAHETYFAAKKAYDLLLSKHSLSRCVTRADHLYMSLHCLFNASICAACVADAQMCLEACISQYKEEWGECQDMEICHCEQCSEEKMNYLEKRMNILLGEIKHHLGYIYMRSGKLKYAEEEVEEAIKIFNALQDDTHTRHALGLLGTIYCAARRFDDMEVTMGRLESMDNSRSDVIQLRQLLERTKEKLNIRDEISNNNLAPATSDSQSLGKNSFWYRSIELAVVVAIIGMCVAWAYMQQNDEWV